MTATTPDYVEYEHWTAAAFAFRVESLRDVLADIDRHVTAGFNEIPRGGVEVGGVLFGRVAESVIRILAFRPVVCEYATGPSYRLSERDESNLARVLKVAPSDPELAGMVPVGWYLSHTRSGTSLRDEDIETFNRYFSEPWQITLVMRPWQFDPTRAAFFFRDSAGAVSTEAEGEFAVARESRPPVARPPQPPPAYPRDPRGNGAAPLAQRPVPEVRKGGNAWIWLLTGAALLAPVLVWFAPLAVWRDSASAVAPRPAARAGLRLSDLDGRLIVQWDPQSPPVLAADAGTLDIADGPNRVRIDLDRAQLASGRATYSRSSDSALVRLTLDQSGSAAFEESTQFVGRPPTPMPDLPVPAPRIDAHTLPPIPPLPRAPERTAARIPEKRPVLRRLRLPVSRPRVAAQAGAAIDAPRLDAAAASGMPGQLPGMGAETVARPAPPPPAPAPAPSRPRAAPASGQMIWTGRIEKRGVVEIDGSQASKGHLSGGLPGMPVTVTVMPGELTPQGLRLYVPTLEQPSRFESAGPQNGWNPTVYVRDASRAYRITVLEAPSEANGWKHLSLRSEERSYSVIVLRWRTRE